MFDNDASDIIMSNLHPHLKSLEKTTIKSIRKLEEIDEKTGLPILEVTLLSNGNIITARVNSVLLAVGRDPNTKFLESIP
jgi:pyruvate/2-oxoglutarate dehydrogenase complex dihydrolipoamide dehydrogenase (E3) component